MSQGEGTGLPVAIQTSLKQEVHSAHLQKLLSIRIKSEMEKKKSPGISAVPWMSRVESAPWAPQSTGIPGI